MLPGALYDALILSQGIRNLAESYYSVPNHHFLAAKTHLVGFS